VPLTGDVLAGPHLAEDAVLRPIERHQINFRRFTKPLPTRHAATVHPGRIRHQTDSFPPQFPEAAVR